MGKPSGNTIFDKTKIIIDIRKQIKTSELKKKWNTCKSMADSCQCMAKLLQYCKVISLQLIKINGKRNEEEMTAGYKIKK